MNFCGKNEYAHRGKFSSSVNAALEGVVHSLRSERNMRLHFLAGFLVLIAGAYFNVGAEEFMFLCFAVTFVLVAEMFNTAVEKAVDLIKGEYDPAVKVIKDISAGAVFVSAINAAIVGYILLFRRIDWFGDWKAFHMVKQSSWHITLIALLVVVGTVLLVKVMRREKNLLRGGMPSGHSAFAFAVWAGISIITDNGLVSILVFFLAALVAKSRMTNGIHNIWQIAAGALTGVLLTMLVFQLLS